MEGAYAKVWLLDAPSALDRPFDYRIPERLCDKVMRGSLVYVPFSLVDCSSVHVRESLV